MQIGQRSIHIIAAKIARVGLPKTISSLFQALVRPFLRIYGRITHSYSQAREDVYVDRLLRKDKGFYVDIGANDPVKLNNTYRFYRKGWRGINVEPDVSHYNRLTAVRENDINLNCGLSEIDESIPFYVFDRDVLSTFSEERAEHLMALGYVLVETREVECHPLRHILNAHAGDEDIDILSIDTEGFDYRILRTNDWERYKPTVIITESNDEEVNTLLTQHGYRLHRHTYIYHERLNSIYVLEGAVDVVT